MPKNVVFQEKLARARMYLQLSVTTNLSLMISSILAFLQKTFNMGLLTRIIGISILMIIGSVFLFEKYRIALIKGFKGII